MKNEIVREGLRGTVHFTWSVPKNLDAQPAAQPAAQQAALQISTNPRPNVPGRLMPSIVSDTVLSNHTTQHKLHNTTASCTADSGRIFEHVSKPIKIWLHLVALIFINM